MSSLTERFPSLPQTGGKTAIVLFILTLIAFVVESQLTQVRVSFYSSFKRFLHLTFSLSIKKKYVQSTLHYRQPFFILYVYYALR